MLARLHRLRRERDIQNVYRRGQTARGEYFNCRLLRTGHQTARAAVVVSTKVSKKAVVRNRIRRRLYAVLRGLWDQFSEPADLVVVVYRDCADLPAKELEQQLVSCLKRLKAIH